MDSSSVKPGCRPGWNWTQPLYHLYQGMLLALAEAALFLVFALYFNRSRKIMPVVLAHMCFDVVAWLYYGFVGKI